MEKTIEQAEKEFQEYLKTISVTEEKYYFKFDDQGRVFELTSIFADDSKMIEIDKDIALEIFDGKQNLSSFVVDIETLTVSENKELKFASVTKIDDILHRIVEKKWSNIKNPDIEIRFDQKKSLLVFSSNKKYKDKVWAGETNLLFLITEYNDPNILKKLIHVNLGDILENSKTFEIDLDNRFSIYTKRIFKNYTFEIL